MGPVSGETVGVVGEILPGRTEIMRSVGVMRTASP